MKPVKSSNIAAIGYDPATQHLTVQFNNGVTWRYEDVPADKHAALMDAESIGSHFHQHIRGGDHKASKVET